MSAKAPQDSAIDPSKHAGDEQRGPDAVMGRLSDLGRLGGCPSE
jgi:hypothetical protein